MVVIGGGTLGLFFAIQLVQRGREVVVIESGGRDLNNFEDTTYSSVGLPHEGIKIARSRSLGGTSNLWGGQLVEYQPADFEGRGWLENSQWPIPYEEIERFHGPTYEALGIPARFQEDTAVLEEIGTHPPEFEAGVELFLTRWLKIPSMAEMFDEEIRTNPHLYVLMHRTVTEFHGRNGDIHGVTVVDDSGHREEVQGGAFALAAGTIESVRLMLHAADSGDSHAPWAKNPNVGAFFQDHVGGRAGSVHPIDKKRFTRFFSSIVRSGFKFQPKLRLTNQALHEEPILNTQGMLHFESSIGENLVYLKQFLRAAVFGGKVQNIRELPRHLLACGRHLPPLMFRYVVQNRVFVPSRSKISFMLQSEQTPLGESRIKIDSTDRDASGLSKVILDWRIGDDELSSMRAFTVRCKEALEESGIAELRLVKELDELDPKFLKSVRDNYHHVGGLCMGRSKKDGVVDSNLCVFGTTNLFVLGASTFRTASNANTTFLAYCFAKRLVDYLSSHSDIDL
ncbi:MAG: FAD-dependent oxidoreductase [Verrucomicrobiota bacterium]